MVLIVSVRVVETYGNTLWWNSLWLRLLEWMGATSVPFYERYEGRENVYHTCRHSQKTVKNDFTILFRFCELENLEDLK